MENLKYNKSHAPDPTARDAIIAADEMPDKVRGAVSIIKSFLKICDLELAERAQIKDLKTGRIWK